MASELFQQGESNTPWWYQTPSLVSQATHLTAFTSSTESNPFDITPSVSSGYFEEDDGSNISEGSFGGRVATTYSSVPVVAAHYQRTDSNWSTSTITEGRSVRVLDGSSSSVVNDFTGQTESTNTLVEGGVATDTPAQRQTNPAPQPPPHGKGPWQHDSSQTVDMGDVRGSKLEGGGGGGGRRRGGANTEHGQYQLEARGPGIPVAPVHRSEDRAPSNAFTKDKDDHTTQHYKENSDSGGEVSTMEGGGGGGGVAGGGAHCEMKQLSHSTSAANQDILRYLAPQLVQNISPMDLLPYLKSESLLTDDDIDFIYDPSNSCKEKVKRIILSIPSTDIDALEQFVDCLEMDSTHQGHAYLAKRFRDAVEKKRLYPFKRLSSLRNKGQGRTPHAPPRPPPRSDSNTRHKIRTDLPSTSGNALPSSSSSSSVVEDRLEEVKPKLPPKKLKRSSQMKQKSSPAIAFQHFTFEPAAEMRMSQSMDPIPFSGDSWNADAGTFGSVTGFERAEPRSFSRPSHYNPHPGNFSSLPRTASQSSCIDEGTRGTKPYSSARYQSLETSKKSPAHDGSGPRGLPISRNASFHAGMQERRIIVSPLERNPGTLSEETDDDSYLYRKGSTGRGSGSRASNYPNMLSPGGGVAKIALPQPYVPPHKRMHEVILEDQATAAGVGTGMENGSRLPATFPRQAPGRSHSMHVQSERSGGDRPPVPVRFSETSSAMVVREKRSVSGVQRGGSFQGYGDRAEPFHLMPASNLAKESVRDLQAEDEADDKLGELIGPVLRKHRRTRSYEHTNAPPPAGETMSPKFAPPPRRGVSEYFPSPSVLEESPERSPAPHAGMAEEGVGMVTYVGGAQDINQQKMIKKKMQWLQQRIKFKDFAEEINFDSLTHYHVPREIIYSGTLYEKGKSRFVVLLTDMLLIVKPKRKGGKFVGRGNSQHQFIDWFSEVDCKTRTPYMLHLLSIQGKSRRAFSESFILHYNKGSSLVKITLHAVSKEAKDIWLDHLFDSIRTCTTANAECSVPLRYSADAVTNEGSLTKLTLTILEANNIAYSSSLTTKNHYCVIRLGRHKCRTPSVKAKCWPTWNYKVNFCDFQLQDMLRIEFYTERISCPDDFLGFVEINLQSATQKHQNKVGLTEMQLRNQHLPLKEGKGTLTVDFELKWDQIIHQS